MVFIFTAALFIAFGGSGCTTIEKVRPDFTNTPEERAYQSISTQMKEGRFAEAVTAADEFQKNYPYSLKLQKARFQKGQALEGLQRWPEAAETYTTISNFSKKTQPEIAAQSVYRLSYVYEAMGDNQRVLTSLFDAQRLEQYLPVEVSQAEIPARLSMAYMKENNADESRRWLEEAEQGLKRALETQTEPITGEWMARTYFNMGSVTASQLTPENVKAVIQGQRVIQKYLIKSLQYGDPVWSAKAAKQIRGTFDSLWSAIDGQTESTGQEKFNLAGPFAELIDEALLFKPAADQASNVYQTEVFTYLGELRKRTEQLLHSPVYTPLIRRSDKASPKPPVPATILKTEDPN
jgi:tetratricopeptide (TPR) repeat protein